LLLFLVSLVALIVGLVKPTVFSRFIKGEVSRKKIATIFGIVAVLFFVLLGITANTPQNSQSTRQDARENTEINTENENAASFVEKTETTYRSAQSEVKTNPTPTPLPPPTPSETVSQKNAVAKAKSYLSYTAFSHDGLIDQLEYEKFSHADAVYGADNSGANWNEQAVRKAKAYMEYSAFSRGILIDQLKYDKFTQAQAEYGADAVGL